MQIIVYLLCLVAHCFIFNVEAVQVNRNTCYRKQNFELVAYRRGSQEGALEQVMVDVGECAKDNTTNNTCLPYELTEHRNYAMAPVIIEKEIIESCQSASNGCQRLPRLVKYYNGTKFEVTIDVGICSGQCHGNTKCQSFDKKTKSISSANGDRCLVVIVDCACVEPSCYRVSRYEGFPEQYTDSHGNKAMRTKIIDVGKCIGNSRCLKKLPTGNQRINKPKGTWNNLIGYSTMRCITKRSKAHSFITAGGKNFSVRTVESCACLGGGTS